MNKFMTSCLNIYIILAYQSSSFIAFQHDKDNSASVLMNFSEQFQFAGRLTELRNHNYGKLDCNIKQILNTLRINEKLVSGEIAIFIEHDILVFKIKRQNKFLAARFRYYANTDASFNVEQNPGPATSLGENNPKKTQTVHSPDKVRCQTSNVNEIQGKQTKLSFLACSAYTNYMTKK